MVKKSLGLKQVLTEHSADFAPQCMLRMFKTMEAHIDEARGTPDWMSLSIAVYRDEGPGELMPPLLTFTMSVDVELPEGASIGE